MAYDAKKESEILEFEERLTRKYEEPKMEYHLSIKGGTEHRCDAAVFHQWILQQKQPIGHNFENRLKQLIRFTNKNVIDWELVEVDVKEPDYFLTLKNGNKMVMEAGNFHDWVRGQKETLGHNFKTRLAQINRYVTPVEVIDWETVVP